MATESDLRDLLRGPDPEGPAIDVDAVLRRARSRRRPRVIAASAAGALALVGVLTPVAFLAWPGEEAALIAAEESAADSDAGGATELALPIAAEALDACGAPLAELPQDPVLVLEMAALSAPSGAESIPVEVVLRNVGPDPITGVARPVPAIAVAASDGIVQWRAVGESADPILLSLAPGESMTFTATIDPVACPAGDGTDPAAVPADLLAAGPGTYLVRAALDVTPDGADIPIVLGGPIVPLTLG